MIDEHDILKRIRGWLGSEVRLEHVTVNGMLDVAFNAHGLSHLVRAHLTRPDSEQSLLVWNNATGARALVSVGRLCEEGLAALGRMLKAEEKRLETHKQHFRGGDIGPQPLDI